MAAAVVIAVVSSGGNAKEKPVYYEPGPVVVSNTDTDPYPTNLPNLEDYISGSDVKSEGVMTYAEYMAAAVDDQVVVETYVQAKQSWWDDKATVYTQDKDGAYFIYNMACSEEDYAKLTPGTKIKVTGYKAEWSGEIEIVDATFEIEDGNYIASALDVTNMLGTDDLISHQNEFVSFKGMTVEDAGNGSAFMYKWDNSGSDGDDLYFNVSLNGQTYTFTVESYLCDNTTDVYAAVKNLQIGDVVDMEGFLYWYEGVNPHITSVTVKTQAPTGTATPTHAPTGTATPTQASTGTATPTQAPTGTATLTQEPRATAAPTQAPTGTATPTQTPRATAAPTQAPTGTATPTQTPRATAAPTQAPVATPAPTAAPTQAPTSTPEPVHTHSWRETGRIAASCEQSGSISYGCSCGATRAESVPAIGHNWSKTEVAASCEQSGSVSYACSNCGATRAENVPATGHNWSKTGEAAASCEQSGSVSYACSNCGATRAEDVPATGHNWRETGRVAASCEQSGSVSSACSNCGSTKVENTPALGHNSSDQGCCYKCSRCWKLLEIKPYTSSHWWGPDRRCVTCGTMRP